MFFIAPFVSVLKGVLNMFNNNSNNNNSNNNNNNSNNNNNNNSNNNNNNNNNNDNNNDNDNNRYFIFYEHWRLKILYGRAKFLTTKTMYILCRKGVKNNV